MKNTEHPQLYEIPPRESKGRDTIARYQAQFRAAAHECLKLLGDNNLDRVYCDHHDDFVARKKIDGEIVYNFYQVKTKAKRNYQWGTNDIIGLTKPGVYKSEKKVQSSHAGRLLMHTIKFKKSCGNVVFMTNVHLDDGMDAFISAVANDSDENTHFKVLVDRFNEVFCDEEPKEPEQIKLLMKKLKIESGVPYLAPDDEYFSAIAKEAVFKFSEIDLQHDEAEEILEQLLTLVHKKSFSKMVSDLCENELDEVAGVGLADMLDILSISKGAYEKLKSGGDPKAIKNTSIIQRLLSDAGASMEMIEFVSSCKADWDIWYRDKRHSMSEFDLNFLQEKLEKVARKWVLSKDEMSSLKGDVDKIYEDAMSEGISTTLNKDLLLGAIFSSLVRSEAG